MERVGDALGVLGTGDRRGDQLFELLTGEAVRDREVRGPVGVEDEGVAR